MPKGDGGILIYEPSVPKSQTERSDDRMSGLFQVGTNVIQPQEILSLLSRYRLMPQFLQGLVIDRAIAEVEFTQEEGIQAIHDFRIQNKIVRDEDIEQWLIENSTTPEGLEEMALRPLRLQKFKANKFGRKVENYFMQQKPHLDRVVYSLIRVRDEGLANEIYYRIEEGEATFAEMAQQHSEGPEAQTQGILGPAPVSKPHPFISRMLEVSKPGQLWPPRAIAEWFIIVRLEQFMPAQLDDQMRQHMINEMFENWLREEVQKMGTPQLLWAAAQETNPSNP